MSSLKIVSGSTPEGNTNWQPYQGGGSVGVWAKVDTSAAGFKTTPLYLTSLGGKTAHWSITGAVSIYSPTPTEFTIFLKWVDNSTLTPETANQIGLHINWMGIES